MKTVRDACKLHPNALSIKLVDHIEQLDELIGDEGDGEAFFERTFITQGLRDLASEGLARLAGASSQAVFHLKQAMGGGKTHVLVALGLLAKHPTLRAEHFSDASSHVGDFGSTEIAAFNGRNSPAHFFWGEIATQIGKAGLFREFWADGPKAPSETDWLALFEGDTPVLILLDEMPPYFHHLITSKVGEGTVADIATRAFANLLTAAGKKANVCVVISDLTAAYDMGTRLINQALNDAQSELGRQERSITPVDLTANEIYDILRKRLFAEMPSEDAIAEIAGAYGRSLSEASKAKTAQRGAEAIGDEVAATYPFHPRLKNVVALFKENEQFKQTRGLLEIISLLLRSVWNRVDNDVFLIGPQHFDLGIRDVREKLAEISGMRDVIATDLWEENQSAHAQRIDGESGTDAAAQVGALLLTSSLSTAVNSVRGLMQEEMVECLVSPLLEASTFLGAFADLEKTAWYLHHTTDRRFYFDRQENLTKMLKGYASSVPDNQVEDLMRKRLHEMFKPRRKAAYSEVLPLPALDDVAAKIQRSRVLVLFSPDSKIPPEEVQRFFEGLSRKNNLCVLTGDKTEMGSVEDAARDLYAVQKADHRIQPGHAQREELEAKTAEYENAFNSAVLSLFDKVLFPIQRHGKDPQLASKPLDPKRDMNERFDGEAQIEKTLTSDPLKLYLDVDEAFDAIRDQAETVLWPDGSDEARWSDAAERYAEQPSMYWLVPGGLEKLKSAATSRGIWEDLGNGYISKRPKPKRTSVQASLVEPMDDDGRVRLQVDALNAGSTPRIHYAKEGPVSESSPVLAENRLSTDALWVEFLAVDPLGECETGDATRWRTELLLQNKLHENGKHREVALWALPRGTIFYTTDGSEPRDGTPYDGKPIQIPDSKTTLLVFASVEGLEAKERFRFPARGASGGEVDEETPASLVSKSGFLLGSRNAVFEGLKLAGEAGVEFERFTLTTGQGAEVATVNIGSVPSDAPFVEQVLGPVVGKFPVDAPVTMRFRKARFNTGHDLKAFCRSLALEFDQDNIEQ